VEVGTAKRTSLRPNEHERAGSGLDVGVEVLAQLFDDLRRDIDDSSAAVGLRRADRPMSAVCLNGRLENGDRAGLEVDPLACERAQLAEPESGERGQEYESPESMSSGPISRVRPSRVTAVIVCASGLTAVTRAVSEVTQAPFGPGAKVMTRSPAR
jgi:hypothetical protein